MDSRRSSTNKPPEPSALQEDDEDSSRRRPTRARIGPLPKNSPDNPLFPPLPPKLPRQKLIRSPHSDGGGARRDKEGSTTSSLRNEWVDGDEDGEGEEEGALPLTPTPAHARPAEQYNNVVLDKSGSAAQPATDNSASVSAIDDKEDEGDWSNYARRQRQARGSAKTGSIGSFGTSRTSVKEELVPPIKTERTTASAEPESEQLQALASSEQLTQEDTPMAEAVRDGYPSEEAEAIPLDADNHRPARLERMASMASSVLTMDNDEDVEMEEAEDVKAPMIVASDPILDPSLAEPAHDLRITVEEPLPAGRKPSIASSTVTRPVIESFKKTRRSSKIDTSSQEDEKSTISHQLVVHEEDEGEIEATGGGDITRCVCGRGDIDVMMISCDVCDVWQHGACVGIYGDEEAPDEYYCDECRPAMHTPLKRYMKLRWKDHNEPFIPPTPADLQHHTTASDRFPPSQSKRWFDWKVGKGSAPIPPSLIAKTSNGSRGQRGVRAPSPISVTSVNTDNRKRSGNARSDRQDLTEPPQSAKSISAGSALKRRPSMNRRASSDSSEDSGPLAGPPTAKKRSTMNSRDAAYEAAIRASLVETAGGSPAPSSVAPISAGDKSKSSKRARRSDEDEGSEDATGRKPVRGIKRTRGDDGEPGSDEDASDRKGKKKRDDEGDIQEEFDREQGYSSSNKTKHPNQYTYRPKPGQPATNLPFKPQPSPQKKPPTAAEARKFANASARAGTPVAGPAPTAGAVGILSWGLPDHLQPFSHVLPTLAPEPLELLTPLPTNPKAAAAVLAADPLSEERQTHFELPSKVKFPGKRMTVGEMKKRVRSVLEYVGRIQIEEVTRGERAKMLGLDKIARERRHLDLAAEPTETEASRTGSGEISKSMQMMDDLTRDLIKFQEIFEGNGHSTHGLGVSETDHGLDVER